MKAVFCVKDLLWKKEVKKKLLEKVKIKLGKRKKEKMI
jgi:hypothetical protein